MIKSFLESDEPTNPERPVITESAASSVLPDELARVSDIPIDQLDPFSASDVPIAPDGSPGPTITERFAEITQPEPQFQHTKKYTPPTAEESARMSGLALTAGVAFASSVVFMLVLGWLVDTLIGTAPWGIVGGIVIGSVIGFIQFFRLNSQILRTPRKSSVVSFLDEPVSEQTAPDPETRTAVDPPENQPTSL